MGDPSYIADGQTCLGLCIAGPDKDLVMSECPNCLKTVKTVKKLFENCVGVFDTPDPVRSQKLSNTWPCQYLDG